MDPGSSPFEREGGGPSYLPSLLLPAYRSTIGPWYSGRMTDYAMQKVLDDLRGLEFALSDAPAWSTTPPAVETVVLLLAMQLARLQRELDLIRQELRRHPR